MKQTKKIALAALLTLCSTATWAQGLKDAYKKEFMIGVAVNGRNVTTPEQMALIKQEFNSITAENDMKPQPTEPKEGEFNWEAADRIANFARQNGIKLRGHCLMWHSQIGRWMTDDNPTKEVFVRQWQQFLSVPRRCPCPPNARLRSGLPPGRSWSCHFEWYFHITYYNTGRMRSHTRLSSPCRSPLSEVMAMTAFLSGTTMMY